MNALFGLLVLASSTVSAATWQLDNSQSSLNFISVKNNTVAETHQFTTLSGQWSAQGDVQIAIALGSVETHIPIRNERMLTHVFDAKRYPHISARTMIEQGLLSELTPGKTIEMALPLQITLGQHSLTITAKLQLVRLTDNEIQAYTLAPVMINADQFGLTEGIAKLQQIAGLSAISPLVPVTFSVTFKAIPE